jgi:hypothetical protein
VEHTLPEEFEAGTPEQALVARALPTPERAQNGLLVFRLPNRGNTP